MGCSKKLDVSLNGRPVNPLNYDGIEVSADQTFAVSRWKGVDLQDGKNEISVKVINPDGSVAKVLKRVVNYSGTAVRGEIVPEISVLVADGKSTTGYRCSAL